MQGTGQAQCRVQCRAQVRYSAQCSAVYSGTVAGNSESNVGPRHGCRGFHLTAALTCQPIEPARGMAALG